MRCEICEKKDNCIYITSECGFICGECYRKIRDSNKGELKRHEQMLVMFKKYGITDKELEKKIECLKQKH
jgi:hypothetical protein